MESKGLRGPGFFRGSSVFFLVFFLNFVWFQYDVGLVFTSDLDK